MADYVGDIKTEKGLKTGLEKLRVLEASMDDVKAQNFHELMRVAEMKDLLLVGKLVATAAMERKRAEWDRPRQRRLSGDDDEHFHGSMILKKGGVTRSR